MYQVAKLPDEDRRILFRNASQKLGLHEAIVEKDFWVCLALDYLFYKCKWGKFFTFKGGTSLSKCYGLIKRFSEDIDIILDWRVLGYGLNEPWEPRSNTAQDKFNKEANMRAEAFLKEYLLPELKNGLSEMLGQHVTLYIDEADRQTICFQYPKIFEDAGILQIIRLEIGALAAWTPATRKMVRPYASEIYPLAFRQMETAILTAEAERTFWEKVTILHHEANRPECLEMPKRYSRHYYDLYCIANSDSKQAAYNDLPLLTRVVDFKRKFYPRKWARYEEAKPGTIHLVPPEYRLAGLEKDYRDMSEMMFGEYPGFKELMGFIGELEREINELG